MYQGKFSPGLYVSDWATNYIIAISSCLSFRRSVKTFFIIRNSSFDGKLVLNPISYNQNIPRSLRNFVHSDEMKLAFWGWAKFI